MTIRHNLGYRFRGLLGGGRLYGLLKDWRKKDHIQPTIVSFTLAHSSTAKRITYTVVAVTQTGGTLSYDVDFGDVSSHGTGSTGGRTYAR